MKHPTRFPQANSNSLTQVRILALALAFILPTSLSAALAEAPKPPDAPRVHIRNVAEKMVLRPRNADHADGAPLVLYPVTDWKCLTWKMTAAEEGTCTLANYYTGKSFAANDQRAVLQVPLAKAQTWKFSPAGLDRWRILTSDGKHCLGVDGGKIVLEPIQENDETQLWELLPGPENFSG